MAELWPFLSLMVTGNTFPSHVEVLLASATFLEEPKNKTNYNFAVSNVMVE